MTAPRMTQQDLDEIVIEAVTRFPEAGLDPSAVQDLDTANQIRDLGAEFEVIVRQVTSHITAKMNKNENLTNREAGMVLAFPFVLRHLDPPVPVMAAVHGCNAIDLISRHCAANPLANYNDELENNLEHWVLQAMARPRLEQMETAVRIARGVLEHRNTTSS